ncbi:MAG: sugar phosphate isomerase/epimerase, partial [Treponema sp.]|nr:sugar phosphate isomerase/epimerase [Treponema sp.]
MRLSTSTNIMCFDEGQNYKIPAEVSVKACAEAGYKFLDANLCAYIREDLPLTKDDWESWSHQIRKLADSLGVRFTQSHGYFSKKACLDVYGNRLDPEYEEFTRRSIIASEILGADWMVMHPVPWPNSDGHADPKKSFRYNKDFFTKWGEFASRHKVGTAIENMLNSVGGPHRYCVFAEELIELVDALNDPMIKVCIDTGHAHLSRLNVANYILAVGDRLKATHIADNHQNADEHIAPFQGTTPWREVMQALRKINYNLDFA